MYFERSSTARPNEPNPLLISLDGLKCAFASLKQKVLLKNERAMANAFVSKRRTFH